MVASSLKWFSSSPFVSLLSLAALCLEERPNPPCPAPSQTPIQHPRPRPWGPTPSPLGPSFPLGCGIQPSLWSYHSYNQVLGQIFSTVDPLAAGDWASLSASTEDFWFHAAPWVDRKGGAGQACHFLCSVLPSHLTPRELLLYSYNDHSSHVPQRLAILQKVQRFLSMSQYDKDAIYKSAGGM